MCYCTMGNQKGVFPVDCYLSVLLTLLEMNRDTDLRQVINPGESNLLRI